MELVQLPAVPDWVWNGFHRQTAGLRPTRAAAPVVERWMRARALGASVEGPPAEDHLLRGALLREHEERVEPFAQLAHRVLERAGDLFASRGYLFLLADADGVVVRTSGGGAFAEEARRIRLIEGACWSESVRGTNAIGTALAEGRALAVNGSAHYGRRFHQLVCYAAPVHPPDGSLLCVVDATSELVRADEAVALSVTAAAEAMEAALRMGAYAAVGSAVMRTLARSMERLSDPVLLVEAPGRLARINAAARVALGGLDVRARLEEALGLGWDTLKQEAVAPTRGGRTVDLPARGQAPGGRFRLQLDPVETHEHGLIAVLVHLEPQTQRAAVRPPVPTVVTPVEADQAFARIHAQDPAMQRAVAWAGRLAASDVPMMILAETGSGKELFAEAIHRASHRSAGPFIAVNCGSIAPSLLESELFGYAQGAFTGAQKGGRAGFFQAADGGTLFLDEVAEMPAAMQVALLRVLEDGAYRPVGGVGTQRADVRVVCATCRDLPALVERGEFRNDLYFRLRGASVRLPPLRARADKVSLARHLLDLLAPRHGLESPPDLSPEAAAWLERHPWPGNVREMKSLLDVALVLAGGAPLLDVQHLATEDSQAASAPAQVAVPMEGGLHDLKGHALKQVLEACRGNISAAAERLGVARSTVYRLMRKHGLIPGT
jgi:transcriptional regulator of acetoin/glycerol metabolism